MPTYYLYFNHEGERTTLKMDYGKRKLFTEHIKGAAPFCSFRCLQERLVNG